MQPLNEPPAPAPVAPQATRSFRAAATEEPWTPPEPGARPRPSENLSGLAAELSSRLAAPELPPQPVVPRHESTAPRVAVTAVPPEPPEVPAGSDQNLADMAHQLEAALRRTGAPEARPPVTDPLAQNRPAEVRVSGPEGWPRSEPKPEAKPAPRLDVRPEPMFEVKPEPKADTSRHEPKLDIKPQQPQSGLKSQDFYDNLEEEMASLLGRPSGKP